MHVFVDEDVRKLLIRIVTSSFPSFGGRAFAAKRRTEPLIGGKEDIVNSKPKRLPELVRTQFANFHEAVNNFDDFTGKKFENSSLLAISITYAHRSCTA